MNQDYDDISKFENHESSHKLPLGWLIMGICLIVFAVYYFFSYMPVFTGWSQTDQYEEAIKADQK